MKTQGSLPTEDAALVVLFGLVVSWQTRLRRLDGWRQITDAARVPRGGRMTHRALALGLRSTSRPVSGFPRDGVLSDDHARAMLSYSNRTEGWYKRFTASQTAKALGLTILPAVVARADEIIE